MSGNVHILRGPAGSGKTTRLFERCRAVGATHSGTILWLGPSLRRLDQLRPSLADVPGVLPLTFAELAGEVIAANRPEVRPLSRCQGRLIVDEVLTELHQKKRLPHYDRVVETRGFAAGVVSLLAELQAQGVSPGDLTQAASDSSREELARIYALYVQRLSELRLCDPDARGTLCNSILLDDPRARPLNDLRAVFVDDFRSLRPPEQALLKALAKIVDEMWIARIGEEDEERAELFSDDTLGTPYSVLGTPYFDRPSGLIHLERNLFRPIRKINPSPEVSGLCCIEAPGLVGEARMVARRVKTLLRDGVAAEEIVISARDLTPYADLLREVFDEYGIPLDVEGTDALQRDSTVGFLLRALRLPEEDWPFAGVTALLRSNWFRPNWPETRLDPDLPLLSEALLRLLAQPRGRESYLEAVRSWAIRKQEGLEDEQAQESRRQRMHELAKQCGPFLERFFHAWHEMPTTAPLNRHIGWLRAFVDDLGMASETRAWRTFWEEIARWLERDDSSQRTRSMDLRTFHRRLQALAASGGTARTPRGPGRVRLLSAPLACDLDVEYLFILGLGEGSFPNLALPSPLLDEADRQSLGEQGLPLSRVADLMSNEMLLFYRLVTRARKQLVLSYPAVDQRGQPLLPGSFLSAVLDLFDEKAVAVERRNMLIQGYDTDEPFSPAEERVQLALRIKNADRETGNPVLSTCLSDAREMARRRFQHRDFSPFEGQFRDPLVIAEAARLFGPERVFSPTALEDYVACPFRFFLRHVLRLDPLEEPREEIEVTRRGQAFHRALARLHKRLKESGIHEPADGLDEEMRRHLDEAIREDITRAAGPAAKKLWELEGERMLRTAARYPAQWRSLIAPWLERDVKPQPYYFEVDFGMPAEEGKDAPHGPLVIRADGIEVRVSGRIDRVDIAETGAEAGFWIIDYKTGRGEHYTGAALADFRKLQLTLYALAVEEVLLAGRKARPLGLAYWLIGEKGPKVVLPTGRNQVLWLDESEGWRAIRKTLEGWVVTLVKSIREGVYPLKPRSELCTQTCDYGEVCRIGQSRAVVKDWSLELPLIPTPPDKPPM